MNLHPTMLRKVTRAPALGSGIVLGGMMAIYPQFMAVAKDASCLDYYSVGESKCGAPEQVKVMGTLEPSKPPVSLVDDYLANYGKPPREFVEFYLNPTSENAQKWVATYQGMLQKGQNISKAWSDAEHLYMVSQTQPPVQNMRSISTPQVPPQPASQFLVPPQPVQVLPERLGAYQGASVASVNAAQPTMKVTYYFSQVCPYCAQTTPELSLIVKNYASKLEFTCVDVTPVTSRSGPNETFITSKLPCKWRLPQPGEVESEAVSQTPTIILQKGNANPVRLSGYVPLAQLKQYF